MNYEIRQGLEFSKWFEKVKDRSVKIKLLARLARVENGNFGDHKNISQNLFELRFNPGPGYRIYYTIQNDVVVLLLAGGDKSSQKKDIKKALTLLR
ncbi:MAG: addiction module antitoxin RelB [Desulfotalea sp.]|nr:MAG: addiction module antitoxin RelB [Desulfotalea sp.]